MTNTGAATKVDCRRERGRRTREAILGHAARLASAEGLDAVSLQRLADDLGMSKSGLFAHFGSKEELQLATVEEAARIFTEEVLRPGLTPPAGVARVQALCDAYLSYLKRGVFPGGCFFQAAITEFDGRPGPVRDAVAGKGGYWAKTLVRAVREAQAAGELDASVDPEQLGWELKTLLVGASDGYAFEGPESPAFARAGRAVRERLEGVSAERRA